MPIVLNKHNMKEFSFPANCVWAQIIHKLVFMKLFFICYQKR